MRCDMCHFWSHISCGGVATPLGYGGSEDNKQLCRACLPRMGPLSADPSGAVQKEEAATVRRRRKDMLRFLERDVATGWPQGVFDLNVSENRPEYQLCRYKYTQGIIVVGSFLLIFWFFWGSLTTKL